VKLTLQTQLLPDKEQAIQLRQIIRLIRDLKKQAP
jgi:hypothetical protein